MLRFGIRRTGRKQGLRLTYKLTRNPLQLKSPATNQCAGLAICILFYDPTIRPFDECKSWTMQPHGGGCSSVQLLRHLRSIVFLLLSLSYVSKPLHPHKCPEKQGQNQFKYAVEVAGVEPASK